MLDVQTLMALVNFRLWEKFDIQQEMFRMVTDKKFRIYDNHTWVRVLFKPLSWPSSAAVGLSVTHDHFWGIGVEFQVLPVDRLVPNQ